MAYAAHDHSDYWWFPAKTKASLLTDGGPFVLPHFWGKVTRVTSSSPAAPFRRPHLADKFIVTSSSTFTQPFSSQGQDTFALPWLWPAYAFLSLMDNNPFFGFGTKVVEAEVNYAADIVKFAREAHKIDYELTPQWATPNTISVDLKTVLLREFKSATPQKIPVLIDAPYAGHSATIADFSPDQSLVQSLQKNDIGTVYVTDWKSATPAMKDFTIDTYLKDFDTMVDRLGGKVHLIGLCQGGWMSAVYAARFPAKVASLVLAGAPLDTEAGEGEVKNLAHTLPMSFYRELVAQGGGRLLGKFMLMGWKGMNPSAQYVEKYTSLFAHINDANYVQRAEDFSRWYEAPLDLPGPYYLEAVQWMFKENRLAKGTFKALGQNVSLKMVKAPVYLLGGAADDITPAPQVLTADRLFGTHPQQIIKKLVPGGHIGLFMGKETLRVTWPEIARWIKKAG